MSSGSLAEVETPMFLSERLAYVTPDGVDALLKSLQAVARQLLSLERALANKIAANALLPVPRAPYPR